MFWVWNLSLNINFKNFEDINLLSPIFQYCCWEISPNLKKYFFFLFIKIIFLFSLEACFSTISLQFYILCWALGGSFHLQVYIFLFSEIFLTYFLPSIFSFPFSKSLNIWYPTVVILSYYYFIYFTVFPIFCKAFLILFFKLSTELKNFLNDLLHIISGIVFSLKSHVSWIWCLCFSHANFVMHMHKKICIFLWY